MPPEMETREQQAVIAETQVESEPTDPGPISQSQPVLEVIASDNEETDATQDKKVVELRTSDFKIIKARAKEKGRQTALAELDDKAKAAGFASIDEAFSAIAQMKAKPSGNGTMAKAQDQRRKESETPTEEELRQRRANRELERLKLENTKATRKWRQEEKRRRDVQKRLDAKDAEMQLREAAVIAGVTDVDYSMRILARELANKSEDELKAFDEKAFFAKLVQERPYLGRETVVAATTGNGSSDTPPAPSSETVQQQTEATQFDARNAKAEDFEKRLKTLGLNSHL